MSYDAQTELATGLPWGHPEVRFVLAMLTATIAVASVATCAIFFG